MTRSSKPSGLTCLSLALLSPLATLQRPPKTGEGTCTVHYLTSFSQLCEGLVWATCSAYCRGLPQGATILHEWSFHKRRLNTLGAARCKALYVGLVHIRNTPVVFPVMLRAAKQQRRRRRRAEDSDAEDDVADSAQEQESSRLQPLVSCVCMISAAFKTCLAIYSGLWLSFTSVS